MKLFNIIIIGLLLLSTIACSSTKKVKIVKKPLLSDHHLMMSLLNRPMTGDKKLMLAFAKQQEQYHQETMPVFVNAILIRGDKSSDNTQMNNQGIYSALIAKDLNAISLIGPF